MKRMLYINQINFDDPSFLKENEDLIIPSYVQYPEETIDFWNILKRGVFKKEEQNSYPDYWFLFDNDGNIILCYHTIQHIYLLAHYNSICNLFSSHYNLHVNKICIPVLEQYFGCKADRVYELSISNKLSLENVFRHIPSKQKFSFEKVPPITLKERFKHIINIVKRPFK